MKKRRHQADECSYSELDIDIIPEHINNVLSACVNTERGKEGDQLVFYFKVVDGRWCNMSIKRRVRTFDDEMAG